MLIWSYICRSSFPALLLLQLNAASLLFSLDFTFYLLKLAASLGVFFCLAIFLKIKQTERLYRGLLYRARPLGRLRYEHFSAISGQYALVIPLLADVNRLFGQIVFGFMLTNLPLNALLLMMLLMSRLSGPFAYACAVFVGVQLLVIFILSLIFAKVPPQFHRLVVRLFHGSADTRSTASWTVLERMKLAHFIGAFHTRNMYTFNYARYGKCTYRTFGKVKLVVWVALERIIYFFCLQLTVFYFRTLFST